MAIEVRGNGIGIPADIADKIFQPFFTTKPTGEGTGLGLGIAYDIVHAHGGQLELLKNQFPVNDPADEAGGTIFIIRLINNS